MNYPVESSHQLRLVLRSLRQSRQLTHSALGKRLGASQQRIAHIEASPEAASFDDISRQLEALGCRLVVEEVEPPTALTKPAPVLLPEVSGC